MQTRPTFYILSREHATAIVSWRYDDEYSAYNTFAEKRERTIEYLLDPANGFYSVHADNELIGFCSVGRDGQVYGGAYDDSAVDLGAGMRPDLVGHGNGAEFLMSVIGFVESMSGSTTLRATIASWNQRALRTVKAVGFTEDSTFVNGEGKQFAILVRALLE